MNEYVKEFKEKTGIDFNAFYTQNYKALLNYIIKYNINRADADEITNTAFMKSLEKIDKFKPEYKYKTWLFTIAKRLALQYKIDNSKTTSVAINEATEDDNGFQYYSTLKLVTNNDAEERAELKEHEDTIKLKYRKTLNAISQLDEKYRKYVELHNIQGHSYTEIMEIMGVPMQTVKNRLFYARKKILSSMDK